MPMSTEAKQRFEQEEAAYWRQRDELLKQYPGKWVAVVGGRVVASGEQMNKVAAEAVRKTGSGSMYLNLVGGEDIVLRVRSGARALRTSALCCRHGRTPMAVPMRLQGRWLPRDQPISLHTRAG